MSKFSVIRYAPDAWKHLNGIFCVYKPAGVASAHVRCAVITKLVMGLNELEVRPPKQYAKIEGSHKDGTLTVTSVPSFADRELVLGPRYQEKDIKLGYPTFLGLDTSGVFVMGVNDCRGAVGKMRNGNLLRMYEIECKLGICTENFMDHGKVLEKSTYDHVHRTMLDRVLGSIQAAHQSLAFEYAGVSLQSQAAYDMASRGVVRPASTSHPLVYGIRCIAFNRPDFTIQLQVINETEQYLKDMVNDIGLKLRTNAVCTRIRQTRYGHFHLDHALLRKHWDLENVITNIRFCEEASSRYAIVPQTPFFQEETAQRFLGRPDYIEDDLVPSSDEEEEL